VIYHEACNFGFTRRSGSGHFFVNIAPEELQPASRQFGRNDVTDCGLAFTVLFKVEAPDVELFNYFSLESHALRRLEQRRVGQLSVNLVLLIEKKRPKFLE